MSADLLEQLAQYGADHRERQAPVERHEILARVRELVEPEEKTLDETPPVRPAFLVLAAAAVVAVLIAGLALVMIGRDSSEPSDVPGTDFIRSTEPSLPTTDVELSPSTSTTWTTAPPSGPGATETVVVPSIEAGATRVQPTSVGGTPSTRGAMRIALGAWDDGFLHVFVDAGSQMAAELSDEMLSRFPPEVREAYPDGLQGTIGEVRDRLEADGWLDEVNAALEADPELEAAALSGALVPPRLTAEFTIDGESWTPVELSAPPDMWVDDVFISGSRLVAVGTAATDDEAGPFRSMLIASTQNLDDWAVQTVPDAVDTVWDVAVAANEQGWVAHIEPSLCTSNGNGSVSCGGAPGYVAGEGPPLVWASRWGEEPTAVEGPLAAGGITVTALDAGFLAQGEDLWYSTDGVTWNAATNAPPGRWIESSLPLDDGTTLVFAINEFCDVERYRVDRSGQRWERIALDIEGGSSKLLPKTGARFDPPWTLTGKRSLWSAVVSTDSGPAASLAVEEDGLRLEWHWCFTAGEYAERYELVDTRRDEVLLAEETGGWSADWTPFEHLIEHPDEAGRMIVIDPATSREIISFDRPRIEHPDIALAEDQEVWLLSTTDGLDWHADDLTEFFADRKYVAAARNGDTVLIGAYDRWVRYDLPSP